MSYHECIDICAVVLAGGQGSRLRPLTAVIPKPLVPIGDSSIIELIVSQLASTGIENVVVSTGYLEHLVQAVLGDGRRFGVRIHYLSEAKPLGTAGPLANIRRLVEAEDYLVVNGDTLTDLNFRKLIDWHISEKWDASITTTLKTTQSEFGLVLTSGSRLVDYVEKPVSSQRVSIGINLLSAKCLDELVVGETIGMPDLLMRLVGNSLEVGCYDFTGVWFDLGRFDDLDEATSYFQTNRDKFIPVSK